MLYLHLLFPNDTAAPHGKFNKNNSLLTLRINVYIYSSLHRCHLFFVTFFRPFSQCDFLRFSHGRQIGLTQYTLTLTQTNTKGMSSSYTPYRANMFCKQYRFMVFHMHFGTGNVFTYVVSEEECIFCLLHSYVKRVE